MLPSWLGLDIDLNGPHYAILYLIALSPVAFYHYGAHLIMTPLMMFVSHRIDNASLIQMVLVLPLFNIIFATLIQFVTTLKISIGLLDTFAFIVGYVYVLGFFTLILIIKTFKRIVNS